MSLNCHMLSSSTPQLKPPQTPIKLHSKCGEIYVSQDWNNWTYNCALCQLNTSDIGVFICHIRLQHSNDQHFAQESYNKDPHNSNEITNQSLRQQHQTNVTQDINVIETNTNSCLIMQDTIFTEKENNLPHPIEITRNSNLLTQEYSQNTKQQAVIYPDILVNNGAISSTVPKIVGTETLNKRGRNEENRNENFTNVSDEFLEISSSSESEDVIEVNYNENNNADDQNNDNTNDLNDFLHCNLGVEDDSTNEASIPKNYTTTNTIIDITKRIVKRKKPKTLSNVNYPYKCPKCPNRFKSKQGVNLHYVKIHDKNFHLNLPHKCDVCSRGFKSTSSLNIHKIVHNKDKHFICPLCNETKYREYLYVDHMQTHASNVCYPCYVCGEIYPTDDERMKHWKTHIKDRPYGCEYCFRRYRIQHHLLQHLKTHNIYQCNFCWVQFKADETKRFPFVCPQCEQMPDINDKIQNFKSSHNNSKVFDSDVEIM